MTPHHAKLTQAVERALAKHGRCLILDCHSFSPVPLPYEPDQRPNRPDICLGLDPLHTPRDRVRTAADHFNAAGYRVFTDRPYAGTLVPTAFYQKDRRVSSLMIELNRGLYMDEAGAPTAGFDRLAALLEALCQKLEVYMKMV